MHYAGGVVPAARCLPGSARPRRAPLKVQASRQGERSGIHDPAGPAGSWGQGERLAHKEQAAQEESFRVRNTALEAQDLRSEQRHGGKAPGHTSGVKREQAVAAEVGEMQQERADAAADKAADEEYSHMGRLQKWFMEAKAALYALLKTGYEPL